MQTIQDALKHQKSQTERATVPGEYLRSKGSHPRLQSEPQCGGCQDRGLISYDVPVHDYRFGRLFPCPKCNQVGVTVQSGLQPQERNITLSKLAADKDNDPDTLRMKTAAQAFIERPVGFLSLHGGYGNGKTVALMAIVNAMLEKGIEARYLTAHELMAYLYDAFDRNIMETDEGRVRRLSQIPVLVIDEFDKARDTPYAADMQFHLIDTRYRAKETLGTVFAWNGGLDALPWPAVVSRLREFPVIENRDDDARPAIGERKVAR